MWFIKFRCGCATKNKIKSNLPKRCPYHCATGPTIWKEIGKLSNETLKALNQLKDLKEKQKLSSVSKSNKTKYHSKWIEQNRSYWNDYQKKWREQKRGYPFVRKFAPGQIKELSQKHNVTPNTIYRWIRTNKLKI